MDVINKCNENKNKRNLHNVIKLIAYEIYIKNFYFKSFYFKQIKLNNRPLIIYFKTLYNKS